MGTEKVRLRRLSELDEYRVAESDADPRGWELVSAEGEKIGEVEDLVVDPQALKARYLEVTLENGHARDGEHVLIPVGYARLEEGDERVRVDALTGADADALPGYDEEFDESYEKRIQELFASRFRGESRYGHPRYDAAVFYGSRGSFPDSGTPERKGLRCEVHICR